MKNQHDSSLQIRLASVAILGLLIALAATAYFSGWQVQRHSDLIAHDAVPGTIKAHYMRMAMSRSIGWVMVAASAQAEQSRDDSLKIVHDADLAFADAVKEYEATMQLNPAADRELLEVLKSRYAEFYKQRLAYESLILAGERERSAAFLETDLVPAYLPAIKSAEALLTYNHDDSIRLANSIRGSMNILDRAVGVVMVLALICVAILLVNFAIRRKEVAELREKEEKFSKAFQANPSGIAITEIETGRYIEVNDSFCRILGYPLDQVIGYTILDKGIWNTEEDQSRILESLIKGGTLRNQELQARTRYGIRKTVSINAELIELGGKRCMVTLIEDITQRRQFELRQSELAAIVESSEDAIIGKTLTGIITSWNRGAEKIFGYTATEAIGQPLLILIPAERQHEEAEILARIAQGETVNHFETVRLNKEGQRISISATISPLRDGDGKVIGASKIARDITEQKQAQEAIRENEERIRVLGDNLPNGMMYQLSMGADGEERKFTYISAGVEKLHEVTAEAVMQDAEVLYSQIIPADRQQVVVREAEALAEMKPFVAELRMMLPSGASRWSIVASAPRLTANGVVWDGIEIDITERKRATEQLEMLKTSIDQHFDAAYWMDTNNRFVYVNDTACRVLGYTREELLGKTVTLVAPNASPVLLEEVWKSLRETGSFSRESKHRRKDGHEFPVEIVATYVRFEGREFNCGFARDITDRKRVEHVLMEKQAQLMLAMDIAKLGHWEFNVAKGMVTVDERIFQLLCTNSENEGGLALSPQEYIQRFVHSEDACIVANEMALGVATTDPNFGRQFVHRVIRKDGEERVMLVRSRITLDEAGRTGKIIGTNQDITEQKQTELRIRHLNRVYEVLSDINKTIVREKDSQSMLEEACRVIVEKGEFRMAWVGMYDAAAQKVQPVASAGAVEGYLDLVNVDLHNETRCSGPSGRCFLSGQHVTCSDIENGPFVPELRTEALRRGYRSSASFPLRVGGLVKGIFCLYSDKVEFFDEEELRLLDELALDIGFALEVSEGESKRRQAEQELRWRTAFFEAQVHSAIDGILVVDSNGKKLIQNRRMNELWKIPQHIADEPDDSKQVQFVLGQVKQPDIFGEKIAYLYAHPDESSSDVIELVDGTILERYSSPVCGSDGRYYGRVWTFHDITKRKKLEQQFLRAQRMESIGTLASGVAHDLNNILTPIMMAVPMLRMKIPDVNREMIIDTIETSAERGAKIVKQVLTFGRGLDGEMHPVRVEVLIDEMEKMIRSTFPKDIHIESDIEPNLWLVHGDATQLHQVLLNLCVNARDAMPSGGRLRLSAKNLDIDASYANMLPEATLGPHLLLEVSDTGSGIPPEIMDRIFDPFFTTKEIGKGTGLGLSTVHGIIKSHGGLLKVVSQPADGTIFQIYLPAALDQNLIKDDSSSPPPSGHGELVLVVDDESAITSSAKAVLEANGYRVLLATNGAEALELIARYSHEISVVLTDVMMPVLNGLRLLSSLRETRPDLPVIASTGLGERKSMNELKALQIEAVLSKPYNSGMLLRAVHEVLNSKIEG